MKKGSIVKAMVSNKAVVYFSMLMIFIFGLYAYNTIPKQEYPDTTMPGCYIKVIYPGATPKELEEQVIKPLEERIVEIEDYYYEKSMIYDSMGLIILVVDPSSTVEEIDKRWEDLDKILEELKPSLPSGVHEISVDTDVMSMPHVIFSLSGEGYNSDQLAYYGKELKKRVKGITGIEKVEMTGDYEPDIRISVDMDRLNHYGLTLSELKSVIQAQQTIMPLGTVDTGDNVVKVRSNSGIESIEEIKNIIVKRVGYDGEVITLDRMATVGYDISERDYIAKSNGKECVLVSVYYKDEANIIDGGNHLREAVALFQNKIPNGIEIEEVTFVPENVEVSIEEFVWSLIQGMVIVLIVILIGMGFRNSIIVSLAIPLAVMSTFIVMYLLGMKFHLLSLAALILVLGMLVDNSIVVSDAIQDKIDKDMPKIDACVAGVREVAIPVLSSTLTTIAAFSPLLMLPAAMGAFIGSIPRIVIIALIASYLIAMLVIPVLALTFFSKNKKVKPRVGLKNLFEGLLNRALKHRAITLGLAVVLLVCVMVLSGFLEKGSYPTEDRPFLYVNVETEFPTDIKRSGEIIDEIRTYLLAQEEVHHCFSTVGGDFPRFHMSVAYRASGKNIGQLILQFDLESADRFKSNGAFVDYLQFGLNERIVGANVEVKQFEMTGDGSPIQIRLLGEDMDVLREAGQTLTAMLYNTEGTKNVMNDIEGKEYTYKFAMNKDMVIGNGMTTYDIQQEMNLALLGQEVGTMHQDGESYSIILKGDIDSDEMLKHVPVRSRITKGLSPLKVYGEMTLTDQIPRFIRYDNMPSVTISASPMDGYNSISIQTELEAAFHTLGYHDIRLVSEGEKGKLERGTGDMSMAGLLAIFLVYSILMVQFKSIIQPIIIILTIPLSFIGSILALLLLRQTLSLFAILGFLSLFGVVVNNGIILIDCINTDLRRGVDVYDACKKAVSIRFRPVMLSTTTTVFGLLPLTISGGDLFRPMAIAFMGGLMISTFLTLIIIPVIFCSVYVWQHRIAKIFQKNFNKSIDLEFQKG